MSGHQAHRDVSSDRQATMSIDSISIRSEDADRRGIRSHDKPSSNGSKIKKAFKFQRPSSRTGKNEIKCT